MTDNNQEKLFNKIRNLLKKAESTTFEAEAKAFLEKAQELMIAYAIEEEQLWKDDPSKRQSIETRDIKLADRSSGVQDKRIILNTIAKLANCRMYYHPGHDKSTIVGYPVDLTWTEMLYRSILVQANFAQAVGLAMDDNATHHKTFKSNWWYSFRHRIVERLEETYKKAKQTVSTSKSTDLVLLSRGQQVDRWVDENLRLSRGQAYSGPSKTAASARASGYSAANKTDISGGRNTVTGGRKSLNA